MIAKEMEKILVQYANMQTELKRQHTEGCIKHLSPDYIFKLWATMASMTEREKCPAMSC
jgi:hypothetical protein